MVAQGGSDPRIETPKIGILPHLIKAKWLASNDFVAIRILIVCLCLLYVSLRGYQRSIASSHHGLADSEIWLNILTELLHHSAFLLNAHTLIACKIGLDKLYILHITIFPLLNHATMWIIYCFTNSSKLLFQILYMAGTGFLVFSYLFWGVPTKLLYVNQFREAIESASAPTSEVCQRLLSPLVKVWILSFTVRMVPQIYFAFTRKNPRWVSPSRNSLGYFGLELFTNSANWIYEMYMYFVLNPNKTSVTYFFALQKSFLEHLYLAMVFTIGLCGVNFIILEGFSISCEEWIHVVQGFAEFGNGLRFILLWYYALSEWNVNDLSENALEIDLKQKYGNSQTSTLTFFKCMNVSKLNREISD